MGDHDQFLTTYRKDYVKQKISGVEQRRYKSDYPDVISGPYTEYILPTFKTPEVMKADDETAKQCVERLCETYPKINRYLDKGIDEKYIEPEYKNKGRTVYQVEICKDDYSFVSKSTLSRQRQPLPADWGETPLTIQRSSYRDFKKKFNWNVVPKPYKPPEENLKPNKKEREILKVTTGESEYGHGIGKLGTMIIDESLHGEIKDPNPENCRLWKNIQLEHAGEPFKLVPPYPVVIL